MKELIRHIFRDCPKFVRITVYIMSGILTAVGLVFFLSLLGKSAGRALMILIYYLLLAAGSALVLIYAWKLYYKLIHKHAYAKLDRLYADSGFCADMAQTLNVIVPMPNAQDIALRIFILVMGEHYAEAEKEIAHLNETTQDSRNLAMILTAKIKLYMMTDRMDKAVRLFENHSSSLEYNFDLQPDVRPEYRVYSDDVFEYYKLAAVYSILTNHPENAENYRKHAAFRLSSRTAGESQFYTGLMELNALYARGKTKEAYDLSNQLFMLTEEIQPPLLQSQKNEMRRTLEQAKIFAAHTVMIEESRLTDRNLPTAQPAGPTPEEAGFAAL